MTRYWYEGKCPRSGEWLRLPRTEEIEAIAQVLMQDLAREFGPDQAGKMYGVLLVERADGQREVLKAFSGLWNGQSAVEGWVPPVPGRDRVALAEAQTLAQLESIRQELIALRYLPIRQEYAQLAEKLEERQQALKTEHHQRKQERQNQRQQLISTLTGIDLELALESLIEQSQQDGIERRQLKRDRAAQLSPLQEQVEQAGRRILALKQQRKQLSRSLQAQMHAVYSLTNFAGESASLEELVLGKGFPTGTGDCCAPKLLHYAATHQLKPLAMAEFWWGLPTSQGDKVLGEFYPACIDRCQPLMGFLLSGLSQAKPLFEQSSNQTQPNNVLPQPMDKASQLVECSNPLSIIYEDEWLIAVDKPEGLLSVPGRTGDRQDSVVSRLRCQVPEGKNLTAVHRLDEATSGVLLLARDLETHRHLSCQFEHRQIHKVYEAILAGTILQEEGAIDLPLWGDPNNRPHQLVDWHRGKPSQTRYRVLDKTSNRTRVEFIPLTGRTHQLRVHAASGLGAVILGDRLYGCLAFAERLYLHARELHLQHPQTKETLCLYITTPF
jgi:tRNA pseudouridine32 synthase / 23S rRNA pseudouridine746 synthase